LVIAADVHPLPYGSPPVSSPDYVAGAPGKTYGDSYGPPPPIGEIDGSPRRLRCVI